MVERIHPLQKIYKKLGITRREFSLMAGVSYQGLYLTEKGYRAWVSQKALRTLAELGYDPDEIQRAHKDHLEALGEDIRARILAREG